MNLKVSNSAPKFPAKLNSPQEKAQSAQTESAPEEVLVSDSRQRSFVDKLNDIPYDYPGVVRAAAVVGTVAAGGAAAAGVIATGGLAAVGAATALGAAGAAVGGYAGLIVDFASDIMGRGTSAGSKILGVLGAAGGVAAGIAVAATAGGPLLAAGLGVVAAAGVGFGIRVLTH